MVGVRVHRYISYTKHMYTHTKAEGMFVGRGENIAPRGRANDCESGKKEERKIEWKKPTYEMHNEREMDSEILGIIR